jgi:hypothetical protein
MRQPGEMPTKKYPPSGISIIQPRFGGYFYCFAIKNTILNVLPLAAYMRQPGEMPTKNIRHREFLSFSPDLADIFIASQ